MPQLYRNKLYSDDTIYHIFNRGVDKGIIFKSKFDYITYIRFIKEYLTPKELLIEEYFKKYSGGKQFFQRLSCLQTLKNYSEDISLFSYSLMNNHIHLLLQQRSSRDMSHFMKSLHARYVMYFNKKYQRVGGLFQSRYKAKQVIGDRYFFQVSKYIDKNCISLGCKPQSYPWGSYKHYCNKQDLKWVNTRGFMERYRNSYLYSRYKSYDNFLEDSHIT